MASKMSGQSVMDRVTAAKHTIAGQGLAKTVCKATTEEVMGPKRKHLDYLLQCTNEPNVSIPQLADLLIERTQQQSWVIVFKSLITIHNLMNYGNERFTQYLASNNCSFNLSSFIDKQGVQGYDMSTFIRRYARYLNEKAITYRAMAFDFCKVKRGRDDGLLRTMNSEKLLKTLPPLQKQIDALLEFDCTANELTNGVINACFMLLFKDLIRLFACYNDGTINLLEKYFDMNKKQCKEALDIYKKFLVRMDKVSEFLKVAENVGIDKGDIPDLAKGLIGKADNAPASLLDALEEHLKSLEGKKGTGSVAPPPKPSGFSSAVNTIANNSSIQVSDEEKRKILEEESKQLQQLKESQQDAPVVDLLSDEPQDQKTRESGASSSQQPAQSTNPFSSPQAANITSPPAASSAQSPAKPSDDLLNLEENPFVNNVKNVMQMTAGLNAFGAPQAPSWGAPAMAPQGGFADSNFARFENGTSGSSVATLDVSTTTTSALNPAPTTVTVCQTKTFDPYEALVDMANSEAGVKGEGLSGTLISTSPLQDDLAQGISQQSPALGIGQQSPAHRSASPALSGDFPTAPPATKDLFSAGQTAPADLFATAPPTNLDPFTGEPAAADLFSAGQTTTADLFSSEPTDPFSGKSGSADLFSTGQPATADLFTSGQPADSGQAVDLDLFPTTGPFAPPSDSELTGFDGFGEVLQPVSNQAQPAKSQPQPGIASGDLDSNLALLAGNITMNGSDSVKKAQHQWQPKGEQKKTGGSNWTPTQMSQATTWSQPSFQQSMPMMGYGGQPAMQPGMMAPGMMPMSGGAPMMSGMAPIGGMPMTTMPQMGMAAPMYGGMRPGMQPMAGAMGAPRPPVTQTQPNDPFGAL